MRKPAVEAAGLFDLFALARDEDLDRILLTSMREITLTLETVTPMFLGGADPRGAPELRAPSFRGAMRYWLRAIAGGVIGDGNLQGLRRLESAVMGSTDYGSPIQIRLLRLSNALKYNHEKILPHKSDSALRKAFRAGQNFELAMKVARVVSNEELIWECACIALSVMLTFGGVGLRTRRGHGTLRISHAREENEFLHKFPSTKEGWKEHIKDLLMKAHVSIDRIAGTFKINPTRDTTRPLTLFPCFYNNLIRISENSYENSIKAIQHLMSVIPKDSAFGGIEPRQSSPLWVRPIEIENGRFALLFLLFYSSIQPNPNYDMIRNWIDEKFPGCDINA